MSVCRTCGDPLDPPATGRPPSYCGVPCRRAAEAERARSQRHIGWLLRELTRARLVATGGYPIQLERVVLLESEVADAERRLRELFAGAVDD
jgi:hypothetical protein